jgi:hypothetical protein
VTAAGESDIRKYIRNISKQHTGKEFFGNRSLHKNPRTMIYVLSATISMFIFFWAGHASLSLSLSLLEASKTEKRKGRELF